MQPGDIKWVCKGHNCPVIGEPFFIQGSEEFSWQIDQSEMYCQALAGEWFENLPSDQADAELDKCDWQEEHYPA